MGVFVTPQIEIDAYYASEALGQSKAKKLLQSLDAFTGEQENLDNKPFILIGKGVDTLLTGTEEEFNKSFYVSKLEKVPSDTLVGITKEVLEQIRVDYNEYLLTVPVDGVVVLKEHGDHVLVENDTLDEPFQITPFSVFAGELHNWEAYILQACENINYQPRWGAEAKFKAVNEPCSEYFKDLCNSEGKYIIDVNQKYTIDSIVASLKTHPRTSKYFDREAQVEFETMDFYYQLPIYFMYNNVECKALLDLAVVIKDIMGDILCVEPIDLKTMYGNTFDFPDSVKTRRYDIQGAWYTEAVYAHFCLDREDESLVAPFKFIVESTTKQGKPLIFEMTKDYLYDALNGKQVSANYYVPGINDILAKVNYHTENGWELEKEIQDADEKGVFLQLGYNGIVPINS